jgi:hypothetical protein
VLDGQAVGTLPTRTTGSAVTVRRSRPDDGLFGPDSVTWRVHLEPVLWVGGFRALLLQSLHPRMIRGTYQNWALFDPRRARLHALPDLVGRPRRHGTRRKTEDDKRRNQSRRRALFAAIRQVAAAGLSRRALERAPRRAPHDRQSPGLGDSTPRKKINRHSVVLHELHHHIDTMIKNNPYPPPVVPLSCR